MSRYLDADGIDGPDDRATRRAIRDDAKRSTNPFARAARLKKSARIASVFRALARASHTSDAATARWLRTISREDWDKAGIIAGCRPPSEQTRALVIAEFETDEPGDWFSRAVSA